MSNNQQPVNYIEKEKAIIAKLAESKYELFDGDRDEALDFVASNLSKFTDYTNVVIREQVMQPIWRIRCEREDFIANQESIDRQRHICHNAAIDAVNILNRTSKMLGLLPFAEVDTDNRYAVADFCGTYVNQVYNQGIGNTTIADVTKNRQVDYDTEAHRRELLLTSEDIPQAPDESGEMSY